MLQPRTSDNIQTDPFNIPSAARIRKTSTSTSTLQLTFAKHAYARTIAAIVKMCALRVYASRNGCDDINASVMYFSGSWSGRCSQQPAERIVGVRLLAATTLLLLLLLSAHLLLLRHLLLHQELLLLLRREVAILHADLVDALLGRLLTHHHLLLLHEHLLLGEELLLLLEAGCDLHLIHAALHAVLLELERIWSKRKQNTQRVSTSSSTTSG